MRGLLAGFALMLLGGVPVSAMKPPTQVSKTSGAWLLSFAGKSTYDLGKDQRFKSLLQGELSQHKWQTDTALPEEIMSLLENYPGKTVTVTSGRFVMAPMDFQGAGNFEGLLWCDVMPNRPIKMIFVFLDESLVKDGVADDLDIYMGRGMADSPLPPQFLTNVRAWETELKITSVKSSMLYDAQNRGEPLATSIFSAVAQ